ncbi:MAG: segregation/condensation protein A [Gemmataceae bacterium]
MPSGANADYQVVLEAFQGPLDLLLYLVKREEVDILDIPIARIADQFKRYIDVMSFIDVEQAGEFLVMASTLMEIKSRMLLPRAQEKSHSEEDPRRELVKQLLLYRKIKEAAAQLERREEEHQLRLARQPAPASKERAPAALAPVELWDLVSAFGRLMRETALVQSTAVVIDHTPLSVYMDQMIQAVAAAGGAAAFSSLFTPPYTRWRLIGLFQALLELAKARRLVPVQAEPFGEIWLRLELVEANSAVPGEVVG